jgi:hypothetical protein
MPFLVLLALGAGMFWMRRRSGPTASTGALGPRLEPDLPIALAQEIQRAMRFEENPKTLSEFAESLSRTYPRAAYEIRVKAWVMGGRHGPVPQPAW